MFYDHRNLYPFFKLSCIRYFKGICFYRFLISFYFQNEAKGLTVIFWPTVCVYTALLVQSKVGDGSQNYLLDRANIITTDQTADQN